MNKKVKRIWSSVLLILAMLLGSCICTSAAGTAIQTTEHLSTTEMEIRTSSKIGVRIFSSIDEDYLKELKSQGKSVEYGTLAVPATVIEKNNDAQGNGLVIGGSYKYSGKTYNVIQIKAEQDWARSGGKVYFTGVLVGISGAGYNTRYAARAYVTVDGTTYYGNVVKESGYEAAQDMVGSADVDAAQKKEVIAQVIDACDAKKANAYKKDVLTIASKDLKNGQYVLDGENLPRNYQSVVVASDVPSDATVTLKDVRVHEMEIQEGAQCTIQTQGHTIFDNIGTTAAKAAKISMYSAKSTGRLQLLFGSASWLQHLFAATDMSIGSTGEGGAAQPIPNLEVIDTIQLSVNVPVENVVVDAAAQGSELTLNQPVDKVSVSAGVTINGDAKVSEVEIAQKVEDLVIGNDLGKLTVAECAGGSSVELDGQVDKAVIHGENSTITGSGTITEAEGDAKNDIEVSCPPLNKVVSVEVKDKTHLTVTLENADTKLTAKDFSIKKEGSQESVGIAQVTGSANVYDVTTAAPLQNGTYVLSVACMGSAGQMEFTCKFAVPQIVSVDVTYMLSSNKYQARGLKVVFKDVEETYLVQSNVKLYKGQDTVSGINGFTKSNDGSYYTVSIASPGLTDGTYKLVLLLGEEQIEKEFTVEVPATISSASIEDQETVQVTLSKESGEKLGKEAFTFGKKDGAAIAVKAAASTDNKTYTLTLAEPLKEEGTYTVSVVFAGKTLTKDVEYTIPIAVDSVIVKDAKNIVVTMTKPVQIMTIGISGGSASISTTFTTTDKKVYTVSLASELTEGVTYQIIMLTSTYQQYTKNFVYETPNSIESVVVKSVIGMSKLEVTLAKPTKNPLTKEKMCILCGGGSTMTITDVQTNDNKVYDVTSSVFVNADPNYTFSIELENGQVIQRTFYYDAAMPHVSRTEVLRTEEDTAEFNLYDVDEGCTLYYWIPGYTAPVEESPAAVILNNVQMFKQAGSQAAIAAAAIKPMAVTSTPTAEEVKQQGIAQSLSVGFNKAVIAGLEKGRAYEIYYTLEDLETKKLTPVAGPLEVGKDKVVDPHASKEYEIVTVEEKPRNTITITLNKAPKEELKLQNFAFICPAGSPINISKASLTVSEDQLTYKIVIPENYGHKDNQYIAKVTFADGSYAQKTFRAEFNPPTITGETLSRPSENEVMLTFNSDKAGKCYMGTYTWNQTSDDNNTPKADDILNGTCEYDVYENEMHAGRNEIKIPYKSGDKDVFVLYVDERGNHIAGWAGRVRNIPEYVAPDPVDPDQIQIESVTGGYDDYYGYTVVTIRFTKPQSNYYFSSGDGDVVFSTISGTPLPARLSLMMDRDFDKYTVEIGLMNVREQISGTYKVSITLHDGGSKTITLSKEFTIQ